MLHNQSRPSGQTWLCPSLAEMITLSAIQTGIRHNMGMCDPMPTYWIMRLCSKTWELGVSQPKGTICFTNKYPSKTRLLFYEKREVDLNFSLKVRWWLEMKNSMPMQPEMSLLASELSCNTLEVSKTKMTTLGAFACSRHANTQSRWGTAVEFRMDLDRIRVVLSQLYLLG